MSCTLLVLAALCGAEATTSPSPRADHLDILFLEDKPVRLELHVDIDGKSVLAVWDETFARLFAFYDRDGSKSLDKREAARLPSPFALRQVMWGQFATFPGKPPAWVDLDLDGDGKVSQAEMADAYRRAGLGGMVVGLGKPPATEQLADAILKHLDVNKDGKVDEAEWKNAADQLRKLDTNDDELIGPGELVERVIYPGALGSIMVRPAVSEEKAPVSDVPFAVLPLRTTETSWIAALNEQREQAKKPLLDETARSAAPAVAWRVRLTDKEKTLGPLNGKPVHDARLRTNFGGLRLQLRAADGKLELAVKSFRERLTTQFSECDADANGVLDASELAAPKAAIFKELLGLADRDDDGKLTEKELAGWLDLQHQVARGQMLLTVLDHGTGLFEFFDADHDGSLSIRELRTAWARLKEAECISDGRFDRSKLPRHLLATVSQGHPRSPLGKPVRFGPDWFRAMDRNNDGDVSRREFVGPPMTFDKLDRDKDGLIDPEEAAARGKK